MTRLYITLGGYAAAAILGFLWLQARDAVIEEREGCNVSHLEAQLESERVAYAAAVNSFNSYVSDVEKTAERAYHALEIARDEAELARAITDGHEITLNRLMLEASIDDIPDSQECLNVFVPESAIAGLRLRPDSEGGPGRGADNGGIPGDTETATEAHTADPYFSDVTYGDALMLWGQDRQIVETLNGRLKAIESLGNDDVGPIDTAR